MVNKMTTQTYTRSVEFDFDGNAFIELPEEICEELEWRVGDIMIWEIIDTKIILRKRDE